MITLLYYTASRLPEKFAEKVRAHLLESAQGKPIVSVSQKPLDFGRNICVGEIGYTVLNVYRQILIGLKEIDTEFVACCEDDTIHHPDYFNIEPEPGAFVYNFRWNVTPKNYFYRRRRNGLCTLVFPRELMIKVSEEKLQKYEETKDPMMFSEPGRRTTSVGLIPVKVQGVSTKVPSLTFRHIHGLSGIARSLRSDRYVDELPHWGKASELWKEFYG